jgi:hypothetical protein
MAIRDSSLKIGELSDEEAEARRKYQREYAREYRKRTKVHITSRYNITKEQHDALLLANNGKCAICLTADATDTDHCHETGVVRGMLCRPCNTALGSFRDNTETMARAIAYINDSRTNRDTQKAA